MGFFSNLFKKKAHTQPSKCLPAKCATFPFVAKQLSDKLVT